MSMDSVMGSQLLSISQSSSPRMDCDQLSIKSDEDQQISSSSKHGSKVKLMCSYGGKIVPRPHDSQLRYIGGETRILVVPKSISYSDLCLKLAKLCGAGLSLQGGGFVASRFSVFPKYKLPYEDYDALVSVTCDEDLETMFEEYDRLGARDAPSKLRLFVFPRNPSASPMPSFSPLAKSDREQSFFEALNSSPIQQQIQQIQQQQSGEIFFDASSVQEVIVDAPGVSACSSGSSAAVVQKMIEADSALQSDLPPIITAPKKNKLSGPATETTPVSTYPLPVSPLPVTGSAPEPDQLINPQLQPLQQRLIQPVMSPPQHHVLIQQQVSQLAPIQAPQPQILPPRGPKPKVSSPQDQKRDKARLEASGSPNIKPGKGAIELEPSAVAEALEKLKVGSEKIIDRDEEQGNVIGAENQVINTKKFEFEFESAPTGQMKYGSIDGQDFSLDAFLQEEEKLKQQQPVFVQPHAQPQIQAQNQQFYQQQQPYIIENNMVYYLASDPVAGAQQMQPPQPVQFIQRPVIHPMQFQRGGSGPLMPRQQPPLQRQVSAAYMEQFQRPQQVQQVQQAQQQQKVVFAATRMGPGAQSPSRFRDQMVVVPSNLAQHPHFALDQQPQQQQGFVRNVVDPSVVAGALAQQQRPGYIASP